MVPGTVKIISQQEEKNCQRCQCYP